MTDTKNDLYQFKVLFKEHENQKGHYKINVYFQGDHDFYNQMIATAREEKAMLTCKPMSFVMKLLWREKYLFYFEQGKGKPSKHTQWELEKLLRNEIEHVQIDHPEDIPGIEQSITDQLNFFAREEAKK